MFPPHQILGFSQRHVLALAGVLVSGAVLGCGGDSTSEDPPAEGCSCSSLLSGHALNSALVEGDFGDDAATAPSAIDVVHTEIEDGLRSNVLLVVAREPGKCYECAPAGFAEGAEILSDVASTAQELLLLQAPLATALRAGFR